MTDRLVYRVSEVCAMLGIERSSIDRRIKKGEISLIKLGGVPRVHRGVVEQLMREKAEAVSAELAKELNGYVYFIDHGAFIKIGFSTKPQKRFVKLQTASPFKLILMRTVPGTQKLEAELHARFRHLKSHGEWFRGEPELRKYIRELPRPEASNDTAA